ncbi:hypothetical protein [Acidiferrobacter sp.]
MATISFGSPPHAWGTTVAQYPTRTCTGQGESASLTMYALEASAVYSWPITHAFRVYGRAGLAAWYASATASVTSGGVTYSASSSGSGVDPLLGVGMSYAVLRPP